MRFLTLKKMRFLHASQPRGVVTHAKRWERSEHQLTVIWSCSFSHFKSVFPKKSETTQRGLRSFFIQKCFSSFFVSSILENNKKRKEVKKRDTVFPIPQNKKFQIKSSKIGEFYAKQPVSLFCAFSILFSKKKKQKENLKQTSKVISGRLKTRFSEKKTNIGSLSSEEFYLKKAQSFYSSYSKLYEINQIGINLASPERIRQWAEKILPNKKIIGRVTNANTLHYKSFKPQKGGLFCERIFGPLKDFECACGKSQKKLDRTLNSVPLLAPSVELSLATKLLKNESKESSSKSNNSFFSTHFSELTNPSEDVSPNFLVRSKKSQKESLQEKALDEINKGKNMREDGLKTIETFGLSEDRKFCPDCDVEYTWSIIRRYQLGYIQLVAPVTHLWYLKGTPSYLSLLLNMKRRDLEAIIYCSESMTLEAAWNHKSLLSESPSNLFVSWQKTVKVPIHAKQPFTSLNISASASDPMLPIPCLSNPLIPSHASNPFPDRKGVKASKGGKEGVKKACEAGLAKQGLRSREGDYKTRTGVWREKMSGRGIKEPTQKEWFVPVSIPKFSKEKKLKIKKREKTLIQFFNRELKNNEKKLIRKKISNESTNLFSKIAKQKVEKKLLSKLETLNQITKHAFYSPNKRNTLKPLTKNERKNLLPQRLNSWRERSNQVYTLISSIPNKGKEKKGRGKSLQSMAFLNIESREFQTQNDRLKVKVGVEDLENAKEKTFSQNLKKFRKMAIPFYIFSKLKYFSQKKTLFFFLERVWTLFYKKSYLSAHKKARKVLSKLPFLIPDDFSLEMNQRNLFSKIKTHLRENQKFELLRMQSLATPPCVARPEGGSYARVVLDPEQPVPYPYPKGVFSHAVHASQPEGGLRSMAGKQPKGGGVRRDLRNMTLLRMGENSILFKKSRSNKRFRNFVTKKVKLIIANKHKGIPKTLQENISISGYDSQENKFLSNPISKGQKFLKETKNNERPNRGSIARPIRFTNLQSIKKHLSLKKSLNFLVKSFNKNLSLLRNKKQQKFSSFLNLIKKYFKNYVLKFIFNRTNSAKYSFSFFRDLNTKKMAFFKAQNLSSEIFKGSKYLIRLLATEIAKKIIKIKLKLKLKHQLLKNSLNQTDIQNTENNILFQSPNSFFWEQSSFISKIVNKTVENEIKKNKHKNHFIMSSYIQKNLNVKSPRIYNISDSIIKEDGKTNVKITKRLKTNREKKTKIVFISTLTLITLMINSRKKNILIQKKAPLKNQIFSLKLKNLNLNYSTLFPHLLPAMLRKPLLISGHASQAPSYPCVASPCFASPLLPLLTPPKGGYGMEGVWKGYGRVATQSNFFKMTEEKRMFNNVHTLSSRFNWKKEKDWQAFFFYLSASPDYRDSCIPHYKNQIPNTDTLSTIGAGIIQKLLGEFHFEELKKMDKQNRIELAELTRELNELKKFVRLGISDKSDELRYKEILKEKNQLISRLKLTRVLYQKKSNPESMVLSTLPVLPPDLRPIIKIDGQIAASDLNRFYQRILYRNERLKKFLKDPATRYSYEMKFTQRLLQESVDNLIANGKGKVSAEKDSRGRPLKSLSDILKGKEGRFRQHLLGKRVDYSGRSVIVVGPKLKIHQCGLPKEMALELFLPFLLKRLIHSKMARTVIGAKTLLQTNQTLALEILNEVMQNHPILLNRAPTLHRLGIQAFQAKLVEGRAILLHPLVCPAFNADFDGDQMAVHVPITIEARAEAWKLMFSRGNLLSPATGDPILLPSQDMVLGCYYLTTESFKYDPFSNIYFSNIRQVMSAYYQGSLPQKMHLHSIIWVNYPVFDKSPKILENDHDNEEPIEIRIEKHGCWKEISKKMQQRFDKNDNLISRYIRTTVGRIIFNLIIRDSLDN